MLKLYTYDVTITLPGHKPTGIKEKIKCLATSDKRAIKQVEEIVVRYTAMRLVKTEDVKDKETYYKALKEITI